MVLVTTFGMIRLVELAYKTRHATFQFAIGNKSNLSLFMSLEIASACALILTSLLAVVFGSAVNRIILTNYLRGRAGALFILLG